MQPAPHRKRVQHYNVPGHAHLLTFSCYRREPLLTNDLWRTWLAESINRALERYDLLLTAFVFMPEHLHLLVYPRRENYRMDALLKALKQPFSFRIKTALQESQSPLLETLTIRDRPGHTSFRFWQEGPGHDRNLFTVEKMVAAAEYIHRNPVRRGLCAGPELWKWSSWKFYHEPKKYDASTLPRIHGFPG